MTLVVEPARRIPASFDTGPAPVTLAIPTRNRHDMLSSAVESVLANCPPGTHVIVVDQSAEPSPHMETLASDGHIQYMRDTKGKGLSRARNIALRQAVTTNVVFFDDDCELEQGTIPQLVAALEFAPDVAIAFGTVFAEPSVTREGFIPTYEPRRERVLRGRLGKLSDGGIGACHIVRREAALRLGGYDERIGPGGLEPAPACDDGEFAYRVLAGGYALAHAPGARVRHHGLRRWDEGAVYGFQTFKGVGAAYACHLRGGDPVAALLILQQVGLIARDMGRDAVARKRPRGIRKLLGLAAGVRLGLSMGPARTR